MITVLLVDAHARVRRGLRMRLAREGQLRVVGEAGDGPTGVALAGERRPDVVVLDPVLGGELNGPAVAAALRAASPRSTIVVLTMADDRPDRDGFEAAGVAAFLSKREGPRPLIAAVLAAGHRG
jgi:DNA-binding NarL/FixJ family response regulator